jgi:hypothetical protein
MFHTIRLLLTEGPHDCKNQKIDSASISSDRGESSNHHSFLWTAADKDKLVFAIEG